MLNNSLDKKLSNTIDTAVIYDNILNRKVTRLTYENAEIDLDAEGNIVSYKNLDDYSCIDKDKRNYCENTVLSEINYIIKEKDDLNSIILSIENDNDLEGYKLTNCDNTIECVWSLTWCKNYENSLVNPYDCVNVIVDAKDGSIMLFGKNKMEPNRISPVISKEEAITLSQSIISKFDDDVPEVQLTFFRPNFFWEADGPYEDADFIRLSWCVYIDDLVSVQVDAETGEILGGGATKATDYGRSMFVVNFEGQQECAILAYNALDRLGYNQTGYEPVYWSVGQSDIDWLLSRTNLYGLYLSCHGGIIDGNSFLTDAEDLENATWTIWSNNNFGNWHFVYLDACLTSANNNFANAFNATSSGRCFVGWNVSVTENTALDFNRRFFPRLGTMSVANAVVTSLWESRNAGCNQWYNICDPGFIGDSNYYGWAW